MEMYKHQEVFFICPAIGESHWAYIKRTASLQNLQGRERILQIPF